MVTKSRAKAWLPATAKWGGAGAVTYVLYVVVAVKLPAMSENVMDRFAGIVAGHNAMLDSWAKAQIASAQSLADDRKDLVNHIVEALNRTNTALEDSREQWGAVRATIESNSRALWSVRRFLPTESGPSTNGKAIP